MKPLKLSDEELWNTIARENSTRAFAVLYNRYWKKLYRTANYYLNNPAIADQILHDVFVVLWKRRNHLQIENFDSYIRVSARYHVFSYLRAQKISPVEYIENYDNIVEMSVSNSAENKLAFDDLQQQLQDILQQLPKRCREIFWMSRVDNFTNDEIALKLGISRRTVENQITYALKNLRLSYKHLSGSVATVLPIVASGKM